MSPVSMEVQKTLCCWCCASGPIVMNEQIPRTGFCIKNDSVPIEVSVENGSSREIRQVIASIHKQVYILLGEAIVMMKRAVKIQIILPPLVVNLLLHITPLYGVLTL